MSKITDLIKNNFSYSIEVTPDFCDNDLELDPIFYSITWHAKTHMCKDLDIPPLRLAYKLKERGKSVLQHLSCDYLKKPYLDLLLKRLQERCLCNLFVINGENFNPAYSDFQDSNDLIKYIREVHNDYFCIGVAGYPQNYGSLQKLRLKVKNGADFIITQAVFEGSLLVDYVRKCREADINIPIIPGMFVFDKEFELRRFSELCNVEIPKSVWFAVKEECSGLNLTKNTIQLILKSQVNSNNIHFFSMNKCSNIKQILLRMRSSTSESSSEVGSKQYQ